MKYHLLAIRVLCLAISAIVPARAATSDFSGGWRFHLGDESGAEAAAFTDSTWEAVAFPHPARLEARVTNKTDRQQWEGICWYRKSFTLPVNAVGQVVLVRFEGAMNRASLFANGRKIAENTDGYLPLVGDLTEFAKTPGTINLAVRLDNASNPFTGPKPLDQLDFHLYHGIYRPATLIIKPPLHITDEILENKTASGGVFVTYPKVSADSATVSAQVHVRNSGSQAAAFSIVARLAGVDVKTAASKDSGSLTLAPGEDRVVIVPLEVRQPRLWSTKVPNLYQLDVGVMAGGKMIDSQRERIGIRRIGFTPGGILINGEKLFLRGVNRHQEYPYVGNAVPDNAQYRDAVKIKQAGFDYVRLSHYPQSPAFMAACDELGLVTMTAIMGWQFNPGTPEFESNRIQSARELIRRDRNHPSAVMWEVSLNETRMSGDFIKRLNTAGHEEYPGDQMFTAGWVKGFDVKGASRQAGSTKEFAKATFPAIVSEYGDWEYYAGNAGLNQDTWKDLKKDERNSRQLRGDGEVRLLQQASNFQESHNENLGTQAAGDGLWVMFDYNRGYAEDLESSGPVDLFRLPKFSRYFYQSQRDASEIITAGTEKIGGPMAFIASYWTEKSPLAVRVFSNADEVELFLNNRSLGRHRPEKTPTSDKLRHPPFIFNVDKFEPGELRAVAYQNGKGVAKHSVKTPRPAKAIALGVDASGKSAAAGGDLLFVYARIVDENGTVVPDATTPVEFSVSGDAKVLGDNPSNAEAGIAPILLKTGDKPGTVRIQARAGGLESSLELKIP
ncbi:MAG: glycoside hydrolase family 2 TIM barrel-domain containing protein [Luteolibacter sp.]|uniref:glycoside hydrolase family 2 protein n=1 Tax=Luteolibacter sp. TaxID=1962973 RepID=UPI0032647CFA